MLAFIFMQSSDSAVMFATAYVTIFLQHISNVALMRAFLRHLLQGTCDSRLILHALAQNISKPNHLVSMSQSSTLIDAGSVSLFRSCVSVLTRFAMKQV